MFSTGICVSIKNRKNDFDRQMYRTRSTMFDIFLRNRKALLLIKFCKIPLLNNVYNLSVWKGGGMINEKEFCLVKLKIVSDHCVIICVWGGWVLCSKCAITYLIFVISELYIIYQQLCP